MTVDNAIQADEESQHAAIDKKMSLKETQEVSVKSSQAIANKNMDVDARSEISARSSHASVD